MKDLTVIIPCYNEEQGIADTLEGLLKEKEEHGFSIVVINDGSTDNTLKILNGIKGIEIVDHKINKGYGAGLKSGIRYAKSDLVAFYDADGQHQFHDLKAMYYKFKENDYDMLVGARGKDSHQDWQRKPGKWVLGKFANTLSGRKIPDLNSGLRVIRKEIIIRMLHLFPQGFSFSTTSTIAFMNMGYSVEYFPITVSKRVGKSTVRQLKHGSNTLLLILRLIVLFNPLRIFIPVSGVFFFLGISYQLIFGIWFLIRDGVINVFIGSTLLIISGILIFFFGLVVDQISELRKNQGIMSKEE